MRYLIPLLIALGICFGAQSIALRLSGGRTVKSESNFYSSLGRIQAGAKGESSVMILGSSITGRLPDRAQGFKGWANMGCDGGTAVDVLRAMDEGILPCAPVLVIEANTLQRALDTPETEVAKAMRGLWFRAGLQAPPVAAYSRPAAFLYSPLLALKIGGFGEVDAKQDLQVVSQPQATLSPSAQYSREKENLINDLTAIMTRLKARGSNAVVVWLPPARRASPDPPPWILEWCRRSALPYWDLGQEADPDLIRLTDGIHMDAKSAARTMRSLMDAIPAALPMAN